MPGVTECPDDVYNLWAGWSVEARAGDWSLIKAHIKDVLCSGNQHRFEYLINWLARAVQQPGAQGEVAVVLRGARGTGKGAFARAFGALFGQHFLHLSDARHLTGNFNAHLRDACVVFADEAFYAGDKQHEGQLKRLVTEPTLMIEPKFRNVAPARNCLHVIVSSNEEWVIPAGTDERRFFVLDVSPCRQKDFLSVTCPRLRLSSTKRYKASVAQRAGGTRFSRKAPARVQQARAKGDLSLSFLTKIGRSQSGSVGAHSIRIIWNIRSA